MGKRGNGEGSIYRRKDGRWVGQYTAQTATGQKRRYVYAKTRAEVAAKLAKAIANRDAGVTFDAGNLTVADYLTTWLNDGVRGTVRPSTYRRYEQLCRGHIVPALGNLQLTALSPAHVQRFYRANLDAGLSPRTVQYMHATLHRALGRAVKWGLSPRNVTEAVDVPRPARRDIQPLRPEQARRLLSEARGDRFEALYVLALTTGLRQGELLGLRWEDVDLDSGRLHVRRTLIMGGKLTFGQPKTARGRRSVALAPQAADSLTAHCERQRVAGLYASDALVFCTQVGTPIAPQNLVRRHFKPLLKRVGLPKIRFHDLRHTCATLLLGQGVHPKVVQDLLGHAQITLTLDTYSHVLPEIQAGAVDAMRVVLAECDDE